MEQLEITQMPVGRLLTELKIAMADRAQLESIARSQSLRLAGAASEDSLRLADGESSSDGRVSI